MKTFFALVVLWLGAAHATTVDALTADQLVLGADLVGVVEVEWAGEIVARYRVVDAWKGAKPGASVTLRSPPDAWGPRVPTVLVGQRFFVTAYKQSPSTMASTTSGLGPEPLWFRKLAADYELPLFQGLVSLPIKSKQWAFDSQFKSFEALEAALRPLCALPTAEREARLLESLTRHQLTRLGDGAPADAKLLKALHESKDGATSVALLQAWAAKGSERTRQVVELVLSRAGKGPQREPALPPKPTPASKEALQAAAYKLNTPKWFEGLDVLLTQDCASVATWLSVPLPETAAARAYELAGGVAAKCQPNRAENLRAIAETAYDSWFRSAACAWLHFEKGVEIPKSCTELAKTGGLPGVWAALTLARRGEASQLGRLVDVVALRDNSAAGEAMRARVQVLLSNSAAHSKLPPPPLEGEQAALQAWWKKFGAKVEPFDPWLPSLTSD